MRSIKSCSFTEKGRIYLKFLSLKISLADSHGASCPMLHFESLQRVPLSLHSTKINDHKPSPTISEWLTISVSLYLDVVIIGHLRICRRVSISDIISILSLCFSTDFSVGVVFVSIIQYEKITQANLRNCSF